MRMARLRCCGRGAQRSGGSRGKRGARLCEWRGRGVADVARKEAAEAAVSTLVRLCEWRGRGVADGR